MGRKLVFYKGAELWDDFLYYLSSPIPQSTGDKAGTGRKLGAISARSKSFLYDIAVHTTAHITEVIEDLDFQATFDIQMGLMQKSLVELSDSLGDLAFVKDDGEILEVSLPTLPGSYPGEGGFHLSGSGFVPALGQYVLLREPTSEEGFVTQLTSAAGGDVTAELQQAIDASWECYLVRYFYPNTDFRTTARGDPESQMDSSVAFDITYLFKSRSHLVMQASYVT